MRCSPCSLFVAHGRSHTTGPRQPTRHTRQRTASDRRAWRDSRETRDKCRVSNDKCLPARGADGSGLMYFALSRGRSSVHCDHGDLSVLTGMPDARELRCKRLRCARPPAAVSSLPHDGTLAILAGSISADLGTTPIRSEQPSAMWPRHRRTTALLPQTTALHPQPTACLQKTATAQHCYHSGTHSGASPA